MTVYRKQLWNETITVYHKVTEIVSGKKMMNWKRYRYDHCFWKLVNKQELGGTTVVQAPVYIVRIPKEKASDKLYAENGDVIVKGITRETIDGTPTALMEEYKEDCFIVKSITDNTKLAYTAHWLLSDTK